MRATQSKGVAVRTGRDAVLLRVCNCGMKKKKKRDAQHERMTDGAHRNL